MLEIRIEVYSRLKDDVNEELGGMYSYYKPTEVNKIIEEMAAMNRVVVSSRLTDTNSNPLDAYGNKEV